MFPNKDIQNTIVNAFNMERFDIGWHQDDYKQYKNYVDDPSAFFVEYLWVAELSHYFDSHILPPSRTAGSVILATVSSERHNNIREKKSLLILPAKRHQIDNLEPVDIGDVDIFGETLKTVDILPHDLPPADDAHTQPSFSLLTYTLHSSTEFRYDYGAGENANIQHLWQTLITTVKLVAKKYNHEKLNKLILQE